MNENFYKEFEDKFRGTRETIKSRLQVYLPFVEPYIGLYSDLRAIDLGCGRGEWLEIIVSKGFDAQGVDTDDGMLAYCREIDLQVHSDEAINFLTNLKSESQTVVSGFHLVEHISFVDLRKLVKESMRVLVPGGVLILETPNPENIVVGSSSFYIDPTHNRPIPLELLKFVIENSGFDNIKCLRLQEPKRCLNAETLSLNYVLNGVSPDYAIIAQKQAEPEILEKFSAVYSTNIGKSLNDMVIAYDIDLQKNVSNLIKESISRILTDEINPVKQKISKLEEDLVNIGRIKKELYDELSSVYLSSSWRYTKPLRKIANFFRNLRTRMKH